MIGSDIARYDIFGDDYLIANGIEQVGIEGNILISEQTKKLLEKGNGNYIFDIKAKVEFPELNTSIQTYLICKKSVTSFSSH